MAMDWSDQPAKREREMRTAAEAMVKRKPKKPRKTAEMLTVAELLKQPYHLVARFKAEHPDIYSKIFEGESFELRPEWFPQETEAQTRRAFETGEIRAKAALDERIPPNKTSFKSLDYEEARRLPMTFWEESARLHFGQGLSSDESLEVAYQKMRKGEKGEKNA